MLILVNIFKKGGCHGVMTVLKRFNGCNLSERFLKLVTIWETKTIEELSKVVKLSLLLFLHVVTVRLR